ncbi:MAG TPA: glycosyltransferase family 9 protein [Terriglobia bacterium]|nr:glycosyltransferase family 9 protein [Terriglobia bacterium]
MTPATLLPSLPSGARILIVRLRSIGDILLLTPALSLLKQWRTDLRVTVLIESRFRDLLEGNGDVDEVIAVDEAQGWSKATARLRTIREIRKRRFALCLNLHGGPSSTLLTRLSGARSKAGFEHFRTKRLYDFLIPDARLILGQPALHTAEHQAAAFFWFGLPRREIPAARLFVASANEAWWREKRSELGILPAEDYAVLHPTALYPTKQWAPENFARLGAYVERELRLAPLYSCGPHESSVLEQVEHFAVTPIRRLEGASLGQFAAALTGARLFVGNDSGPAHMAAALGRPSVVIFGSSSSQIWGPWPREGAGRVVQNPWECNPCPGDHCYRFDRPECILSVTFEQVRAAVGATLKAVDRQP